METHEALCAEFVVRTAFTLTGRGTCVTGFIRSGAVHSGDEVRWVHDGRTRSARCIGIDSIREVPMQDPVTVALRVDGADPADLPVGTTLTLYR